MLNKTEHKKHNHICHCGTSKISGQHKIGQAGCVRFMTEPPDLQLASLFTYQEQRGYHQHPCGCWSRYPGSDNSIDA
jgi:hypothetical protein